MPDFETVPVGTTAELERVQQERDALTAYVEAQNSVLENASAMGFFTVYYDSGADHKQLCRKMAALREEVPTTSLTRRDLIKQAGAFELAAEMVSNAGCAYRLVEHADDLRQQANQLETDQ